MNNILCDDFSQVFMPALRPYQCDLIERVRESARSHALILLQAETGSGKSVIALDLAVRAYQKGRSVLFIARGRKLVDQFCGHLGKANVPYGIIMAGRGRTKDRVQVASKDTLSSRFLRRNLIDLPQADLLIIDEAHESLAKEWLLLITFYPKAVTIGLTATPARADGTGLGAVYQDLIQAIPPSDLIKQGWLVPSRVFAPYVPNLKGCKISNGDYEKKELAQRMDRPSLVGDVVTHWRKHAEDRKTLVWGVTVDHSKHLCSEFEKHGIAARHIDASTEDSEREDVLGQLTDGELKVVTNVAVYRQGVDLPAVSCGVIVRPTRSFVLWRQMCGRLKRPYPGKADALILDHAGACYMHGMPDDDVQWSLGDNVKGAAALRVGNQEKDKADKPPPLPIRCNSCHAMFAPGPSQCPFCQANVRRKTKEIKHVQGNLVEVNLDVQKSVAREERQRYWTRCLYVMAHKNGTCGAAACMYFSRFKTWPDRDFKDYTGVDRKDDQVREALPHYWREKNV